jgi:hypothetical protein
MARAEIGVFGGSGFYSFLEDVEQVEVETPYGKPSAPFTIGEIGGKSVDFAQFNFPARMSQAWLDANVPGMADDVFTALLSRLASSGWSSDSGKSKGTMSQRLLPLRKREPEAKSEAKDA